MKLILRLIVVFACLYALVRLSGDGLFSDNLATISSISLMEWGGLTLLVLLGFLGLAIMFKLSLNITSCRIPALLSFRLTVLNSFLNTFLPFKGGVIARGAYLKQNFDFHWRDYALVVVFSQFINVALLVCFLGLASSQALSRSLNGLVGEIGIMIPLLLLTALAVLIVMSFKFNKLQRLFLYIAKSAKRWLDAPLSTFLYLCASLFFHVISALRLYLAFYFVGVTVDVSHIVAIYCLLSLGMAVAFTPGNIGVRELSLVVIAGFFSINTDLAFSAAIVDRLVGLSVTVIVGGPLSMWFLRQEKNVSAR